MCIKQVIRTLEACPSPWVSPAAWAALAVVAEAAAADVPLVAGVAAEVAATGVAADAPAAAAVELAAPADCVFALSPVAAAHAAAAVAVYVDRQPFAGPPADGPGLVAARPVGAPGPAASANSAAVVDVAAQVADCHSAADLPVAPMAADRFDRSAVDYPAADWAARLGAAY